MQQKTHLMEQMFIPWFMSLHDRASKLSSGDQVVPVVVKMTEFRVYQNIGHGWLSKPFYDAAECKLQLKVVSLMRSLVCHCYFLKSTSQILLTRQAGSINLNTFSMSLL